MPSSQNQNSDEPLGLLHILAAVFSGVLFGLFLSKLKTPIQESVNSISPNVEADDTNQKTQPESPFATNSPPSQSSPDNPCKCCHHKTPRWKIAVDVGMLLATVGAFGAAAYYAHISKKMWYEMKTTNFQNKTQWEAEHRPWMGLDGINFTAIKFSSLRPSLISLHLEGTMVLKNFGTYPSFGANAEMTPIIPIPMDKWTKDPLGKPPQIMFMCPEQTALPQGGEVVFPSRGFVHPFFQDISWGWRGQNVEISHVWILVCISYYDGRQKEPHHTRIWLRSIHTPNAQWVVLNPASRYMPVTAFESWGEQAD
ncbi:MAG: hypothetical protein WA517_02665 [Candidatus Acidiferrum sp.]